MVRWMVALLVVLTFSPIAGAVDQFERPGDYRTSLTFDGQEREFLLHVPFAAGQGKALPLVVALHGGGGDMYHMGWDESNGLLKKADQAGFVLVVPNGYSRRENGRFATWNAGRCCGAARDTQSDDVGFLRHLIETLIARGPVNPKRVFIVGMSNGAMMAYRMACESPDFLRGIMAVAGTDNTVTCAPKRPIAVLHIHARNDDHVLFNGGRGPAAAAAELVTDFTSVPATIEKWVRFNRGVAPKPVLTVPGATCELHPGLLPVQLCVTETGGHSWPGSTGIRGTVPSQAIRATDVMWDFFSKLL